MWSQCCYGLDTCRVVTNADAMLPGSQRPAPATRRYRQLRKSLSSSVVLLVADLLHPLDILAIQYAGDSQVGHRGCCTGAMPVLDARWADDYIARVDLLHRLAPFLRQPHSCVSPTPAVTTRRCPAGWVCHAERAPGSKVTHAPEAVSA